MTFRTRGYLVGSVDKNQEAFREGASLFKVTQLLSLKPGCRAPVNSVLWEANRESLICFNLSNNHLGKDINLY